MATSPSAKDVCKSCRTSWSTLLVQEAWLQQHLCPAKHPLQTRATCLLLQRLVTSASLRQSQKRQLPRPAGSLPISSRNLLQARKRGACGSPVRDMRWPPPASTWEVASIINYQVQRQPRRVYPLLGNQWTFLLAWHSTSIPPRPMLT